MFMPLFMPLKGILLLLFEFELQKNSQKFPNKIVSPEIWFFFVKMWRARKMQILLSCLVLHNLSKKSQKCFCLNLPPVGKRSRQRVSQRPGWSQVSSTEWNPDRVRGACGNTNTEAAEADSAERLFGALKCMNEEKRSVLGSLFYFAFSPNWERGKFGGTKLMRTC